jgi:hypothetical protein
LTRVKAVRPAQVHGVELGLIACKEHPMLDVILIALGLGFFVLAIGYTILCDRL